VACRARSCPCLSFSCRRPRARYWASARVRAVECLRTGDPLPRHVILLLLVFKLLLSSLRMRHPFSRDFLFKLPRDEGDKRALLLEAETSGLFDYVAPARLSDAGTPATVERVASALLCLTDVSVSLAVYDSIIRLPCTSTLRHVLYPFNCLSTTIFFRFGKDTFRSHACVLGLRQ
jgi:hypothetical protein